jgi:hypothetical protein
MLFAAVPLPRPVLLLALLVFIAAPPLVSAGTADPQIRTDHPWYPGELACSSFERLRETQAELFARVTGQSVATDEQRALASWLWRTTHYAHGEEGAEDLWGKGFTKGGDLRNREYWTGLFAHGFGLCGTTHSQWTAELDALIGQNRGRGVGVAGHNSFEVFLTGGVYGDGKWALLDHDLCTVAFDEKGAGLLSIREVQRDPKRLLDRSHAPARQQGWPICGLHPGDGAVFTEFNVAEYAAGYAAPPPLVHLRRGETLRRFPQPGLDDGKTFVFWGRNYNAGGIPGPERSLTWVNQPEKLFGASKAAKHQVGQARYGNARYTYRPDFAKGDYREGVIEESDQHIVFEFYTPYVIAATPAGAGPWAIYESGCRNGLTLSGKAECQVSISTDQGRSWQECGPLTHGLDLTDHAKGKRQYFLRFGAGAKALAQSGLTITTVCQANSSIMPRLSEERSRIRFEASGQAIVSAGPNLPQAEAHLVEGKFGSPKVTLELAAPRGEQVVAIHAAAHVNSGNPPPPDLKQQIEFSLDGGATWQPLVKDWTIARRGDEPKDLWSQSLVHGAITLAEATTAPIRVRFHNNGNRSFARCEAHLIYRPKRTDDTKLTVAWKNDSGAQQAEHLFTGASGEWALPTGKNVQMLWTELAPVSKP